MTLKINNNLRIHLPSKIGRGYGTFWRFKGRYRVVKGGRGSKKSTTTAMWIIYNMMKYPLANTLVLRRVFNTHKDSTYTQLKWAANNLGVSHLWHFSKSPLEITYKPTGQKILFRGLDDPMSITSITVEIGYLCWAWFEEAFQVMNEDDFNKVDMSIRGELPMGYFKQITLSFNPWSEKHWLKKRFFDTKDDNILALTTNYKCNEFLGDDDRKLFESMKKNNPRRYKIEGLGEWGIADGLVYENFTELEFDVKEISKRKGIISAFGLDFGYTNDPTAFICCLVDEKAKELFIFDEHYQKAMSNTDIVNMIKYKGYSKERIIADSAEPKSIDDIKKQGIRRIKAAQKGKDSILNGIQNIQDYKMYVHPKCENTLVELNNYVWDTKDGQVINKPIDDYNHLMDALRYAMEQTKKINTWLV
ncbi:PBSX family phage terminase large subunit [Clostridium perfringens]|uniref:PBSX family phage terminase large subunit n=1 Tax=Clostridium perfringens TaxID=1502 RepID=UPI000D70BD12|nr:PBSX family phage terminase large subunit [Clostridium perfringens]MCI5747880.1 PBSX family phage terminase large subunit [Clostridium perfringens]MDM0974717.1 PBSX family phage terminase large subunit [Clostridium perfringens]MEA5271946.1 PBSX family phage terminase large subunit [Clostridium perfringens]MEA5310210.1 PBSX family phage terminase large subunit [Clostridium perfringens]MEA5342402.1 PBSX family phage terminase large subunit [Clostridium perfringens]